MRIASWNINSIRPRLALIERLVAEAAPDVLCLQETKVADELFPHDALEALGFAHRAVRGMKGYNGVAILSRLPLADAGGDDWAGRTDARHVRATLPGGVVLHNFYVPAGGDEPDPAVNDKFAHKLRFLDELAAWGGGDGGGRRILVGDLNIAPLESDVWSHKQLLKVVSHTPVEVEKLEAARAGGEWVDAVRHFVPEPERLYSWWSYRARDWAASDRGRRLDHVWVAPALVPALERGWILRAARGWERASDHVPVIVDLAP